MVILCVLSKYFFLQNNKFLRIMTRTRSQTQLLTDISINGIADYIKAGRCKKIITMVGAGISTAAGIPDFRSPESGLYHNLEKYNLPNPEAIFDINYFRANPKPFFSLAKDLFPGNFLPTTSHYFLKLLDKKGLLLRHYTQNFDTLERMSCLAEEKMVEAHGSFYKSHCIACKKEYNLAWMKGFIFADKIPRCSCGVLVKPDIIFYGEHLSDRYYELARKDFLECDLLIIMGSSLLVEPFASLVADVSNTCPRLLINLDKSPLKKKYPLVNRDVFWQGTCDSGCEFLANKLGWKDELIALKEEQLKKIIKGKEEAGSGRKRKK